MTFRSLRRMLLFVGLSLFAVGVVPSRAQSAPELPEDVEISADTMEYLQDSNMLIGTGNVEVVAGAYRLTAARISYDLTSGDVVASGGVHLEGPDTSWDGAELAGNLKTKTFNFGAYEAQYGPWTVKGASAHRDADGRVTVREVQMTTCEDWWLHAETVTFTEEGAFEARKVAYKVRGVTVLYLPAVKGHTRHFNRPFYVKLGYDGEWGGLLVIGKEWQISEQLSTRAQLEFRTSKGVGVTSETAYTTKNSATRLRISGYYDSDPAQDRTVGGTDYNNRFETEEWRALVEGEHRSDYYDDQLTLRIQGQYQTDQDVLFEYYRDEYRANPQAPSRANLAWVHDRYEISLGGRVRLNDFETVVERLPELRVYMPRQGVFGTPLEYESQSTLGYLRMNFAEYDLMRTDTLADSPDYETFRADTLHMLFLPLRWKEINIVPRLAGRITYYGDGADTLVTDELLSRQFALNSRRVSPDLSLMPAIVGEDGESLTRLAGEIGLELNTKFYATWNNYSNDLLKLDGLRHIVVPYINYTYMPEPSEDKEDILFFDSVDRLDEANFVRLGVKQRFQTRRDQQIYTFAKVETYADFHFDPEDDRGNAGDLGILAELRPRPEFGVAVKTLVDMDEGELNAFTASLNFGKPRTWSGQLSYLYRNEFTSRYSYSMASDLTQILSTSAIPQSYDETHGVALGFQIPLGQKMQFRTYHYFDLEAGELGLQRYELQRDLNCWAIILRVQEESGNVSAVILFSLKGTSSFKPERGTRG